jgi:hypothetical protein
MIIEQSIGARTGKIPIPDRTDQEIEANRRHRVLLDFHCRLPTLLHQEVPGILTRRTGPYDSRPPDAR